MAAGQGLQRRNHAVATAEPGATGIRAEFAPARKPHDDDRGENAEHELQQHHDQEIADAAAAIVFAIALQRAVDDAANDAPAAIETNGNVIVMASLYSGTFTAPSNFYEWNGSTLNGFPAPPNAINDPSFVGHLLVLPTGQMMFTDFTTDVQILTTAGTFKGSWQPVVKSAPTAVRAGIPNYLISGTQFNGLTQAAAYGDDFQDATNYPLVRIVNNASGHVFYCRTHDHSSMGVATGSTRVSTRFDVPADVELGASRLYVIANGIPSAAVNITVQ